MPRTWFSIEFSHFLNNFSSDLYDLGNTSSFFQYSANYDILIALLISLRCKVYIKFASCGIRSSTRKMPIYSTYETRKWGSCILKDFSNDADWKRFCCCLIGAFLWISLCNVHVLLYQWFGVHTSCIKQGEDWIRPL